MKQECEGTKKKKEGEVSYADAQYAPSVQEMLRVCRFLVKGTYFDGKRLPQFEGSPVGLGFDQDGDLAKREGGTIGSDFFGCDNLVGVLDTLQVKHDTNRD